MHAKYLGRHEKLNAFGAKDPAKFVSNLWILAAHDPRSGLDDGYPATEAAIGLRHFQADIAAAEYEQMRGQVIEFERLDMCQRPRRFEARNIRNCRNACPGSGKPVRRQGGARRHH